MMRRVCRASATMCLVAHGVACASTHAPPPPVAAAPPSVIEAAPSVQGAPLRSQSPVRFELRVRLGELTRRDEVRSELARTAPNAPFAAMFALLGDVDVAVAATFEDGVALIAFRTVSPVRDWLVRVGEQSGRRFVEDAMAEGAFDPPLRDSPRLRILDAHTVIASLESEVFPDDVARATPLRPLELASGTLVAQVDVRRLAGTAWQRAIEVRAPSLETQIVLTPARSPATPPSDDALIALVTDRFFEHPMRVVRDADGTARFESRAVASELALLLVIVSQLALGRPLLDRIM